MTDNAYDAIPYESFPYTQTQPDALFSIGTLFGLPAVAPKKCSVLELGCASGGNIIPMAVRYPDSRFVGIDYSKVQIEEGQKHVTQLGLKNLGLKCLSILDINDDFGKFDYIVVHGILSWVPKNVQDKIFEICDRNLSENGIAYISYNTLPGWSTIRGIREMMLYHTDRFDDPKVKVTEARNLLQFIKNGNTNENSAYSKFISQEIATVSNHGDSYLLHDHLEANNEAFYFHDLMKRSEKNNLQYLGESNINSMFLGNFPTEISDTLLQIKDDIVRVEQYMDFVRNTRFRSTLLCHKSIVLDRNLSPNKFKKFYFYTNFKPKLAPEDIDLTKNEPVYFTTKEGSEFSTTNALTISLLLLLNEQKKNVSASDATKQLNERLKPTNSSIFETALLSNLLSLVLKGVINFSSEGDRYITSVTEKPKVADLARYQATYSDWITTQRSEKVKIDIFNRVMLQYLDGSNTFNDIVEKMSYHVKNDEISINENNEKITDPKKIEERTKEFVKNGLNAIAPAAILVA